MTSLQTFLPVFPLRKLRSNKKQLLTRASRSRKWAYLIATLWKMLLQQIVEKLDAELDRLRAIREIVSRLQSEPVVLIPDPIVVEAAAPEELPQAPAAEPESAPKRPRVAKKATAKLTPRSTGRRGRGPAPEAHALAKAIPAGPVVVSAAALAKERQARTNRPAEYSDVPARPEPGSLGALIRSMELRSAHPS